MWIIRKRKEACTHDYCIFTGVLFNRRAGESGCFGDHVYAGGIFIYSSLDEKAGLEKYGDSGSDLWLRYDDKDIAVDWPIPEGMELIMSDKDQKWGGFREYTAARAGE